MKEKFVANAVYVLGTAAAAVTLAAALVVTYVFRQRKG